MLTFEDVYYSYNDHSILNGVNFEVDEGEMVYLIGKSGAGKSTIIQLIYMNILPQLGSVRFAEFDSSFIKPKDLPFLRRKIGIVFQEFRLLKDRTIYDNLSYVLEVTNTPGREIKKRINDALNDVGLAHRKTSFPYELSGGEQQRIAIARAIINDPLLIVADEPTGNLDPETSKEIVDVFQKINSRGTAVILATHNYDLLNNNSKRIIKIDNGKITEERKTPIKP